MGNYPHGHNMEIITPFHMVCPYENFENANIYCKIYIKRFKLHKLNKYTSSTSHMFSLLDSAAINAYTVGKKL